MTDPKPEPAPALLPCPRCGTYAEVVHASHIRCGNIYNCDCETRLGPKAWNRRAAPDHSALIRELRDALAAIAGGHIPAAILNPALNAFEATGDKLAFKEMMVNWCQETARAALRKANEALGEKA